MRNLSRSARRVILAHGLAAIAMSIPWPLLMVLVWSQTHSELALGLTGAARMLPYVLISWAAGRLADARRRDQVLRATVLARVGLLALSAVSVVAELPVVAVVSAGLAVAAGTPAYPAAAAALPGISDSHRVRATELLVTVEVGSFVVGPAIGGLLVAPQVRPVALIAPILITGVAWFILRGVRLAAPAGRAASASGDARTPLGQALRTPRVQAALIVVCGVNLVLACLGVSLLGLAHDQWRQGDWGFGLATSALGFGAFAAPLLDMLGHSLSTRINLGLGALAALVALTSLAPRVWWAAPLLLAAGACATHVESAATATLQEQVPDEVRASILGLTDSAMVAAAMAGAALAPFVVGLVSPMVAVAALAVIVAANGGSAALVVRRAESPTGAEAHQRSQGIGRGLSLGERLGRGSAPSQSSVHAR